MRIRYIFIILIYSVIEIAAQGGGSVGVTDSRATAMGKSYTVSSRGIYSINRNPANLAIPQNHNIEISTLLPMPNISMGVGNDFLTLNDYNFFFTGDGSVDQGNQARYLSDSDKQRFKQLFDQGNLIHTGMAFSLFGISINAGREIGSFALLINDRIAAKGGLPTDYIDLLLYGNEAGRVYDLKDATFQSSYTRDYSLSYAREFNPSFLKRLSIGASIKMVHGFWYGAIENFGSSVETLNNNDLRIVNDASFKISSSPDFGITYDFESDTLKNSSFSPFPTPAGTGFGFDLGFTAELNDILTMGLAVTDIGSITWDQETVEYSSGSEFLLTDLTDSEMMDSLTNSLQGEGHYVEEFSTSLPTAIRFGVAMQVDRLFQDSFPGELLVVMDFNQGFNDLPTNSTSPRFSMGFEWKLLSWFPLRSGISLGGRDKFNWGLGFGFDFGLIEMNMATSDMNSIVNGNGAKRIGVSLGSLWKF